MNLYYAASLYHILCFSLHALLFDPGNQSHLVVSDNIFSKNGMEELVERLNASKIFSRVTVMAFTNGEFYNDYTLEEDCSDETVKKYLEMAASQIEQWLRKEQINLDDYENKYTAIDHRLLGMYFLYKGYPYSYFEDGNGLLSRSRNQLELHKQLQYESFRIITTLSGLGENDLVKEKFANVKAQLPGFHDPKMTDFDAVYLFGLLSSKQRQQIFTVYGLKNGLNTREGKTFLFLTRFAKYLKNPDVFHHMYLNSALLDLFAKEHELIIKPHPRDYSGTYTLSYPNAVVLERTFPSELLPYLQDKKYDRIMTIGSTAIDALSSYGRQLLKFDQETEDKSDYLFTYYMAVRLILHLFPDITPDEIGLFGCSMELMNPLFETYAGFLPKAPNKLSYPVAIVDCQKPGFKPQSDFILYLHTDHSFQFFKEDPDCFSRLHFMDLTLSPQPKSWLSHKKEHYLLAEIKDPAICRQFANYSYSETLSYTKAHLEVGFYSLLQRKCLLNQLLLKALRTVKDPLLENVPLYSIPDKDFFDENTLFLLNCQIRKEMENLKY